MKRRLIDADALLELVQFRLPIDNQNAEAIAGCVDITRRTIEAQPTVDAVEVVHGYWKKANDRPKSYIRICSVCGKEAYFCGEGCSYKCCPNCGARMMDGEDNGNDL